MGIGCDADILSFSAPVRNGLFMADRFFTHKPLSPGEFILDGPEAHHMAAVRRFAPGDRAILFNGDGAEYRVEIAEVGKKQVVLRVLGRDTPSREVPFPIVVGSALPKGDRLDFLLGKLVEVGATRFVPLVTARSIVNPKDGKVEKWRRAVIEASKQCGRNVLMRIDNPLSLVEFLGSDLPMEKWILHTGQKTPSPLSKGELGACAFAIGPEGGFTEDEIASALGAGWLEMSFGPRTLRTETAAIAAAIWAARGQ